MNKIFIRTIIYIMTLSLMMISCSGRVPSAQSAHSMTKGFLKNYGHKYDKSLFGQNKIEKVGINQIVEQSRNMASIDAFVHFDNGQTARILITAKKTPPLGWKVSSWEMFDLQ